MSRNRTKKRFQKKTQKGRGLLFANGGSCGEGICQIPQMGGANCRVGVLFPRFGGSKKKRTSQKGKGCGCGTRPPMMDLPAGLQLPKAPWMGGSCGCSAGASQSPWRDLTGGYRPTKRNKKYLQMWKRGESIGFTMRSSLKAKGLIPRSNGPYKVSPKYQPHH